jgi:Bacterial PH domain
MNGMNDIVLLFVPIFVSIALVFVLSRIIVSSADKTRQAREIGNELEFAPNRRNYVALVLFEAYLVYMSGSLLFTSFSTVVGRIGFALWLLVALFLLAVFPGSVITGDEGLRQVYWLRKKSIAWKDVRKIVIDEKRNRVTITGNGGAKIAFMRQLPDKARLLAELGKHCPDKVPAEARQLKAEEKVVATVA